MMVWVDMLLRFYIVIEPYYVFWQVEQPILSFIMIMMLLWLMLLSLGQMSLRPILFILSFLFRML